MAESNFEYGQAVRVIRNIRDDGTFPGSQRGKLLIQRGSVSFVRNRCTFLQDQVIYEVHFIDNGDRIVGCREEELIDVDAEWIESKYEFRQKVKSSHKLIINDELLADIGDEGQVLKVLKHDKDNIIYHVRLNGRTLLVPEAALEPVDEDISDGAE